MLVDYVKVVLKSSELALQVKQVAGAESAELPVYLKIVVVVASEKVSERGIAAREDLDHGAHGNSSGWSQPEQG